MDDRRVTILKHIAELWRGDWSGHIFDGRDGRDWIYCALTGDDNDLTDLEDQLERIEKNYA